MVYSIIRIKSNKKSMETFGVDMQMSAPGLKRILDWGTKRYGTESTE